MLNKVTSIEVMEATGRLENTGRFSLLGRLIGKLVELLRVAHHQLFKRVPVTCNL